MGIFLVRLASCWREGVECISPRILSSRSTGLLSYIHTSIQGNGVIVISYIGRLIHLVHLGGCAFRLLNH